MDCSGMSWHFNELDSNSLSNSRIHSLNHPPTHLTTGLYSHSFSHSHTSGLVATVVVVEGGGGGNYKFENNYGKQMTKTFGLVTSPLTSILNLQLQFNVWL